jgi:hypothetical protein
MGLFVRLFARFGPAWAGPRRGTPVPFRTIPKSAPRLSV